MKRMAFLGLCAALLAVGCAPSPQELRRRGIVEFQRGDIQQAEEHLRIAVELDPWDARTLYWMGRIMQARGAPVWAAYYYQCCIDSYPGHTEAWRRLAEVEEDIGPLGEALRVIPLRGGRTGAPRRPPPEAPPVASDTAFRLPVQ